MVDIAILCRNFTTHQIFYLLKAVAKKNTLIAKIILSFGVDEFLLLLKHLASYLFSC